MRRGTDLLSTLLYLACLLSAAVTAAVFLLITGYILAKGLPHISPALFEPVYDSDNLSLLPALVNTALMIALSLGMAAPAAVSAAIYLAEYSPPKSAAARLMRAAVETLAGIPSIVYGLFGYLCFASAMRLGFSFIAGAATSAVMILPIMITTSEQALRSVPRPLREGSFGLGAGRLKTVLSLALPCARQGITAGVILSVGRIAGETAALIYTAGTHPQTVKSLLDSGRTLSVHMYVLSSEGLYTGQSYATAAVLLAVVASVNALAAAAARRAAWREG